MKYLLTGTAGFIGFHVAKKLLNNGDYVLGLDNINDYYDTRMKYARLNELGIEKKGIDYFYLDLPAGEVDMNTEKVLDCLKNYSLDLVVTTFNRVLGKRFVKFYTNKAVNMHLALLPLFKGLDPVGRALNSGQSVTGASMHYITEDIDGGSIISRVIIPLDSDETRETLSKKYKFALLPFMLNTLNLFCEDNARANKALIAYPYPVNIEMKGVDRKSLPKGVRENIYFAIEENSNKDFVC